MNYFDPLWRKCLPLSNGKWPCPLTSHDKFFFNTSGREIKNSFVRVPIYPFFHSFLAVIKAARQTQLSWPTSTVLPKSCLQSPAFWDWLLLPGRRIWQRSSPALLIASIPTSVSRTTCSISGSEANIRLQKKSRGMLHGSGTTLKLPPVQRHHPNKHSYCPETNIHSCLARRNWHSLLGSVSLWCCSSAQLEKETHVRSRITANPH